MGFLGAVHSELVKVKHTPFWTMHLCLPVVGALLFIVYYVLYGSTADYKKLKMILEITATVFPLLISVIVSLNVLLEEKASHFQILLVEKLLPRPVYLNNDTPVEVRFAHRNGNG